MVNLLDGEVDILAATNIVATRTHFDPQVDEYNGKVKTRH